MNITGHTAITGLIGHPIAHSKSFAMHNAAIEALGLAGVYVPFVCHEKSMLTALIPAFYSPSFLGANVTTPHKENVMALLDSIDEMAQKIGAVNTICKTPQGTLVGKNSDAEGFQKSLAEANIATKERTVLILGAGGAAKAIAHALASSVSSLIIANRTPQKATSLIENLREHYPTLPISFCSDPTTLSLAPDALIIQCTSLGNHGEIPPHPPIHKNMSVVDLLYTHTPLLEHSAHVGATIHNGMSMLMHQASLSFSWWFHTPPPIDVMRSTLFSQRSFA